MTVDDETTTHDGPTADADLVLRTRSGDTAAFGELWRRHYPSGMSVARSITSSIDPDDLVQESYTRIYQAIIKGGGPNGSFRAYLFTSIRNTAAAWGRSRRESAIDELDTVADPGTTEQAANEALDRSLTAEAFRSLPSRWQEVLWYTEIEQMKPQEVAPLLGMKAGAVSQLAFRAREGLREAWIQAHLRSAEPGSECQWTIEHLGAYSRGNLSTRDHKRLEMHLDECARCMTVAAEAKDVSTRLALVLLPLVLGVAGASGYLAMLQGGGTPLVALAAMPSGIVDGGIAATGIAGASGGGVGGGGSSGGGGSTGALVGAGSAALVVAGMVAAATILPGLTGANPSASMAAPGDGASSSITSDIAPDASMSLDEPVVVEQPAPAPPAEDSALPDRTGPAVAPPVAPVAPEPPVLPEGSPTWGSATVSFDITTLQTHYVIPLSGVAGATVRVHLDGSADGAGEVKLQPAETAPAAAAPATGAGTIDLRPTLRQLCQNATVTFSYVAGDAVGTPVQTTLHDLSDFRPPELLCLLPAEETEPPLPPDEGAPVLPIEAAQTTTSAVAPASEAVAVPAEPLPAEAPAEPAPAEPAAIEPTTAPAPDETATDSASAPPVPAGDPAPVPSEGATASE